MSVDADVDRLRAVLGGVEAHAAGLAWAARRPWRRATHVFVQHGLPAVDGHDLDARGWKQVLRQVVDVAEGLDTGAVLLITGRGRHSVGRPGGVLGEVTRGRLGHVALERGWGLLPHGAGAHVLIVDPQRAPSSATGGVGLATWLLLGLFAAAALLVAAARLGWLP